MPRYVKRRVPAWKRKYRKVASKRRGARRALPKGYIRVTRKLPMISLRATGVLGNAAVVDTGFGNCLAIGTPTVSPGATNGYYDVPFAMNFQLQQVEGALDFTSLFDNYRINGAYVRAILGNNSADVNQGSSAGSLPWIEWIEDHDDATPETALVFRQKMGAKTAFFGGSKRMIKMWAKPKPEMFAAGTTTATASAVIPGRSPYLNVANADINHYGIKGVIHNYILGTTPGASLLNFDIALSLSLKDVQ